MGLNHDWSSPLLRLHSLVAIMHVLSVSHNATHYSISSALFPPSPFSSPLSPPSVFSPLSFSEESLQCYEELSHLNKAVKRQPLEQVKEKAEHVRDTFLKVGNLLIQGWGGWSENNE